MRFISLLFVGVVACFSSPATYACALCGDPSAVHDGSEFGTGATLPGIAEAAPGLSSRPGAPYTLYLDMDGFNYTGTWGFTGKSPGTVPAYTGSTARMTEIWARTAEKYSAFNINVTTVDPSGLAATNYAARQSYYDAAPRVMHTLIGGSNAWYNTGAGGVSYVGVLDSPVTNGLHTNWAFPDNLSSGAPKAVTEAVTHEDGHALGLSHQNDYNLNTASVYSTNNGATGNGSYAPQMGTTYNSQRGTWRVGTYQGGNGALQNDVQVILENAGLSLVDDGIGHSFGTASALPLTGSLVNASLAGGIITPLSTTNPNPIGVNNYTKDYFRFSMGQTGTVSLTLTDGGDWITPGTVSPGATLRSKLNLYKASDISAAFGFGIESVDTLSRTFTGTLDAGDYFAEITSYGGYTSTYDPSAKYFDMGSYVLRGSGILPVVVPEGGTWLLVGAGLVGLIARRRRK